jgi:hypothetical protein
MKMCNEILLAFEGFPFEGGKCIHIFKMQESSKFSYPIGR